MHAPIEGSEVDRIEVEPADPGTVPLDYVPETESDLLWALGDPFWRVGSGYLYKITTKDDAEGDAVVPFRPNDAQWRLLIGMHYRTVVPKARQRGITTCMAIVWLDHALFVAYQRCGIIAHTVDDAAVIFRNKVRFAYDHMPPFIRDRMPLSKATEHELVFAHNGSSIRVDTSMRSDTIHRLHISEMGKIAAKFPQKAQEIMRGSLPAVPLRGIAVMESTAEGPEGAFFEICKRAKNRQDSSSRPLGPKEWKLHFESWWDADEYQIEEEDGTEISPTEHAYFDKVEREVGRKISLSRRRWYISTRDNEAAGDSESMWQEYPSTFEEAFRRSTEGSFFAPQIARTRAEGRIGPVPFVSHVPVHTFWDIGSGDGTAVWLMQHVGQQHRFPLFIENWSQGYEHYVNRLRETGMVFGIHHLPHDADHERQMAHRVGKPIDMLQELAPDWTFTIVPRVQDIQHGITLTRRSFETCWFDAEGCKEGLVHLELYRKVWNARAQVFTDQPYKLNGHSEAADAFRQFAQGYDPLVANSDPYGELEKIRRRAPHR